MPMKKLNSIKLAQLNEQELSKREMNRLAGGAPGDCCVCGCHGSSSSFSNFNSNKKDGKYSPEGGGFNYDW